MEAFLIYAKISAVLTVLYAGLNVHQLTSSYQYLITKADEFRKALKEEEGNGKVIRLNIVFYVVVPLVYLLLLHFSMVPVIYLALLAIKFSMTASMDVWVEKRILSGQNYTVVQHYLSRADNFLNIVAAVAVVRILLTGGVVRV